MVGKLQASSSRAYQSDVWLELALEEGGGKASDMWGSVADPWLVVAIRSN